PARRRDDRGTCSGPARRDVGLPAPAYQSLPQSGSGPDGQHLSDLLIAGQLRLGRDRKSTRLNSSHVKISYAVFCLTKKKENPHTLSPPPTRRPPQGKGISRPRPHRHPCSTAPSRPCDQRAPPRQTHSHPRHKTLEL